MAGMAGTAGTSGATTLVSCPTLPGATASPLYSITVNGSPLFVEQMTKFSPEMQVHYAHASLAGAGTATIAVTVKQSFSSFTLSPKSRNLSASKSGNTITFNSGPNYLILGKYLVGELWMKSNVTMYLACGAVLYGSSNTADFNTGAGGVDIEDAQHAMVGMYQIKNAKILGRGVLDSNGHYIRGQSLNANLLKIEQSSNILVDGIVSRDPSYWNTLVYRSDQVTIQN